MVRSHVLVLDGNENQAVASVRSLSGAGYVVHVGADTSWSKAGWSRYASGRLQYTAPQVDGDRFVDDVVRYASLLPGLIVLPMTERTTLPVSARRALLLDAGARFVLPPHETVLRAFDKSITTRLAESLGIEVPRTEVICTDNAAALSALAERLRYPVVVKASTSEVLNKDKRVLATGAPHYAKSPAELARAHESIARRADRILIQEFVEGSGTGYFALAVNGQIRAEFAHRRIRDVRPTGSGSAVRESVPLEPRIAAAGRRILEALGWHGPAMVEFRVRPDGTPVFVEVNGRFWNSLALAVHAGVDFPRLAAELAERADVEVVTTYKVGVRCRWLLGDVRHLIAVLRGPPPGYEGKFPGKLRTLRDVLIPVRGTVHDHWSWEDPGPELGDWLHFLLRRTPARLREVFRLRSQRP